MFMKSQCPWGRTSHHVQAENLGHSGPPPPPKPLTVLPQIVLPQIRFLLSSGNRCPGRGQSRVTARAAVCEAEETGHPGLTAAQREGPALVTSAHLPGKTHPCTSPSHLLPRERAAAVEWLQLYSLNTSEDRRTNAETGAKAD